MRKPLLTLAVLAAFAAPAAVHAQATAAAPASPHSFTGNVGLFSDYRFRGLTQTMTRPALQGGFDYAHSSGFYIGNWNSNVSSTVFPNANLEMDLYAGFKPSFGEVTGDIGAIYYYYPGSRAGFTNPDTGDTNSPKHVNNKEIYAGAAWKFASLKYYYSLDEFFSVPDTKGSWYLDGTVSFDLGSGFGIMGHVGRQKVKNFSDASYTDWKVGVTKDIGGFLFGAAYVDTNAKDSAWTYADARKSINIGKAGVVLSVSKTF